MNGILFAPWLKQRIAAVSTNRRRLILITELFFLYLTVFLLPISGHPAWAQSSRVLKIYLARHGETDWNTERRLQGGIDTPLNPTGLKQAAELAERLRGIPLDMVYSSNLRRSRDTADRVRGEVALKQMAGLNERRLGKFEGKWLNSRKDPATAREYPTRSRDPDDELDGGESLNQFYARVRAAMSDIRRQHSSGAILIVGHAATNQMILREIFNLSLEQSISIKQANDDLYLIELDAANPAKLWKFVTAARLGDR